LRCVVATCCGLETWGVTGRLAVECFVDGQTAKTGPFLGTFSGHLASAARLQDVVGTHFANIPAPNVATRHPKV
jgi:hypothetical protein